MRLPSQKDPRDSDNKHAPARAKHRKMTGLPASGLGPSPSLDSLDSLVSASRAVNATPFPFMKLPAELRACIYRMAFCRPTPLLLHISRPQTQTQVCGETQVKTQNANTRGRRRPTNTSNVAWRRPFEKRKQTIRTDDDPINPALLRACSSVYKEARQILYGGNRFKLEIDSGKYTLMNLHQQTRSYIRHVFLTVSSHYEILDDLTDLVRLGLRYCWGLKTFTLMLPAVIPDDPVGPGTSGCYANAFRILRWLPQNCVVQVEGNMNEQIMKVVKGECTLQNALDEVNLP